jgi:hypothetical protein
VCARARAHVHMHPKQLLPCTCWRFVCAKPIARSSAANHDEVDEGDQKAVSALSTPFGRQWCSRQSARAGVEEEAKQSPINPVRDNPKHERGVESAVRRLASTTLEPTPLSTPTSTTVVARRRSKHSAHCSFCSRRWGAVLESSPSHVITPRNQT